MNSNGRELLRGVGQVPLVGPKQEVKLRHILQDGSTAAPVTITGLIPIGGDVQALVSFGGLTKLEALAGQIAGDLVHKHIGDDALIAADAVNIAEAVLAECKRRQAKQAEA